MTKIADAARPARYNLPMLSLHWLMALIILGMIAVGFLMEDVASPMQRAKVYGLHKSIGILVLMLVSLRVIVRAASRLPAPVHPGTKHDAAMERAASLAHLALYGFMFFMPLTGWAFSNAAGYAVSFFGLFTVPDLLDKNQELRAFFNRCHYFGALGLCGLLALHAGAALYHQFCLRDRLIFRMLPGKKSTGA